MKVVEPIRDKEMLCRCLDIARRHDESQNASASLSWELLLYLGFNTGLRVSDLVKLRVRDVQGQTYLRTTAKKTGKDVRQPIPEKARGTIRRLVAGRNPNEWLFQSTQMDRYSGGVRHITRQRAYQIINGIARKAGIKDRIGCHTLRKTFGYHHYKQFGDLVTLQRILGHDNRRDTLVYIGIQQDEVDKKVLGFDLLK